MNTSLEQLPEYLQRQFSTVFIVIGDELLLKQDAFKIIRYAAKKHGVNERISYQVDTSFAWDNLHQQAAAMSLFAEKRIVELHFNKVPTTAIQNEIKDYVARFPENDCLLINFPRLTTQQQKAKWFQAISNNAVVTVIWSLTSERFPTWLNQRLRRHDLIFDKAALQYLVDYTQGNLLAAKQAIEKLLLLYGTGNISAQQVLDAISDGSRYSVFDLIDYIIKADSIHIAKALYNLQAQGENTVMMLGALSKELRILTELTFAQQQGSSIEEVFSRYRVWDKRKSLLQKASQRLTYPHCSELLRLAAQLDRSIKGLRQNDVWQDIENLCLSMSGGSGKLLY